jgi:hypothetical protein
MAHPPSSSEFADEVETLGPVAGEMCALALLHDEKHALASSSEVTTDFTLVGGLWVGTVSSADRRRQAKLTLQSITKVTRVVTIFSRVSCVASSCGRLRPP